MVADGRARHVVMAEDNLRAIVDIVATVHHTGVRAVAVFHVHSIGRAPGKRLRPISVANSERVSVVPAIDAQAVIIISAENVIYQAGATVNVNAAVARYRGFETAVVDAPTRRSAGVARNHMSVAAGTADESHSGDADATCVD